jgi:hypothetical protein
MLGNRGNSPEKEKGEFFHEKKLFIAIFIKIEKNCRKLLLSKKSKIFIVFNGVVVSVIGTW